MHPSDMKDMVKSIQQETPASLATVTVNGEAVTLPVIPVPGQRKKTVGIALGYGRSADTGRTVAALGNDGGVNAFGWVTESNGTLNYNVYDCTVVSANETYAIASTQTHHTMMGRKIVNETDLETYQTGQKENEGHTEGWNPTFFIKDSYNQDKKPEELDLWDEHPLKQGQLWGMNIDLNACIGCGACVTACGSENNIPIVGKDEVRRNREMFWMRIDRYYRSDVEVSPHGHGTKKDYDNLEIPSEYPQVVYQPVMCQHCNHAPCETVCPVAATTHSMEGMNQMAYNRCVGTRYCANNCPYKVRRFNWFQYDSYGKFAETNPAHRDPGHELSRMVLNPDVVVRARGVMEKCSLCVQRIQAGKLEAKKEGYPVMDGQIQTACSGACPTNAITFGDQNDEKHAIAELNAHDRAYNLLEEVGVRPNITYMTKVRNEKVQLMAAGAHHGDDHAHTEEPAATEEG